MRPPFVISSTMLSEISRIERLIGQIESLDAPRPQPQLRRANRIRTIQGSLAIEGNTLSLEQVTAVIEGKPVLGKPSEIQEVKNAVAAYEAIATFHPRRLKDLLKAHRVLMDGLIPSAGRWRSGNVGVIKGSKVSHIAP
ncbi:MAG: Fic family protein, partial [Opitutales bacterium]